MTEPELNKNLSEILQLIGSYYTMDKEVYKARAFNSAAVAIGQFKGDIQSGKQLRKLLTGIGPSIESAIDEYILTNDIQRLHDLEAKFADRKQIINYFTSFYGIGPVTAIKFYNKGYRTLDDLWTNADLTNAQKTGILWREHIPLPITRDEMEIINYVIGTILINIKWNIAGSYRRGEQTSGDIDILIESQPNIHMPDILKLLKPYIPAKLAQGPTKFMGIFKLSDNFNGHRIDIRLIDPISYSFALLYFTGSQKLNILMRQQAISLGLTLNEYHLLNNETKQLIHANSEEEIFHLLHLKYVPPTQRLKTIQNLEPE